MVDVVHAMTEVRYPQLRAQVRDAVSSFADPAYQRRVWIERTYPTPTFYDDLAMNVATLFDDVVVLPDPAPAVGAVLHADEVAPLRALGEALEPLVEELRDADDATWLDDPRWPVVVDAAAGALRVLDANGWTWDA